VPKAYYTIAPKREARARIDPDWLQSLHDVSGIQILSGSARRAQIVANNPQASEDLKKTLGDDFLIEENILHSPLKAL
jgi:hypothetical protein